MGEPAQAVNRCRRRLLAAGLGIALLPACRDVPVDERLPPLPLRALEGEGSLAALPGPMLVNYWATWCAPCRDEMPSLERLGRRLAGAVRLVGVTVDEDLNLAREWLRKLGITFPVFADPGTRLSRPSLRIQSIPETLLVSDDRRILMRTRGAREWDSEEALREIQRALGRAAEPR
jgi:thiol-disulfide isomerase/thioredoxin